MKLDIAGAALAELEEAVEYYEGEQAGLGERLWREAQEALDWISAHPLQPRLRPGGYRRVNLRVFPYYIAYVVRDEVAAVLAIANACRRPEYWMQRKGSVA